MFFGAVCQHYSWALSSCTGVRAGNSVAKGKKAIYSGNFLRFWFCGVFCWLSNITERAATGYCDSATSSVTKHATSDICTEVAIYQSAKLGPHETRNQSGMYRFINRKKSEASSIWSAKVERSVKLREMLPSRFHCSARSLLLTFKVIANCQNGPL